MKIGYRSCNAVVNAGKIRQRIIQRECLRTEREMRSLPHGPEHRKANARLALWQNLFTAQNYMVLCFTYDSDETKGFKPRLEILWQEMGKDLKDLPRWTHQPKLKAAVSFNDFKTLKLTELGAMERNFAGNLHEIPENGFERRFQEFFDLLVNDLWKTLGMSKWCDGQMERTPWDAEVLKLWDAIITDAENMITDAAKCHIKIGNNFHQYLTGEPDEEKYARKYTQNPDLRYRAVNGLFAIDPATLPRNYAERVEAKLVSYR